eukprot:Gb_08078 [translate_table: standard]
MKGSVEELAELVNESFNQRPLVRIDLSKGIPAKVILSTWNDMASIVSKCLLMKKHPSHLFTPHFRFMTFWKAGREVNVAQFLYELVDRNLMVWKEKKVKEVFHPGLIQLIINFCLNAPTGLRVQVNTSLASQVQVNVSSKSQAQATSPAPQMQVLQEREARTERTTLGMEGADVETVKQENVELNAEIGRLRDAESELRGTMEEMLAENAKLRQETNSISGSSDTITLREVRFLQKQQEGYKEQIAILEEQLRHGPANLVTTGSGVCMDTDIEVLEHAVEVDVLLTSRGLESLVYNVVLKEGAEDRTLSREHSRVKLRIPWRGMLSRDDHVLRGSACVTNDLLKSRYKRVESTRSELRLADGELSPRSEVTSSTWNFFIFGYSGFRIRKSGVRGCIRLK